jgi:hypothetical protein
MVPEEIISFKLSKPQNNKEMCIKGSCNAERRKAEAGGEYL